MTDGIFASRGNSLGLVLINFQDTHRAKPIRLFVKDGSSSLVSDLVRPLKKMLSSNQYDLIGNNCQHFSRKLFDKLAMDHSWDPITPTDWTSLLRFLRNGGVFLLCVIFELFLLFKESRKDTSMSHYQYVLVIAIAFFALPYICDEETFRNGVKDWYYIYIIVVLCALSLEAMLISPFSTIRKRIAQYGNIWKYCGHIIKLCLPLP